MKSFLYHGLSKFLLSLGIYISFKAQSVSLSLQVRLLLTQVMGNFSLQFWFKMPDAQAAGYFWLCARRRRFNRKMCCRRFGPRVTSVTIKFSGFALKKIVLHPVLLLADSRTMRLQIECGSYLMMLWKKPNQRAPLSSSDDDLTVNL